MYVPKKHVRFEVAMAVSNKIMVTGMLTPCNFVAWYPEDGGSWFLYNFSDCKNA
jgi:hypothetical protein